MFEASLIGLIVLAIGYIVFNFRKESKNKKMDIETVTLKDLSVVWTCHNKKRKNEDTSETFIQDSDISQEIGEMEVSQEDNEAKEVAEKEYYKNLLKAIGDNVNIANDKGLFEIFNFEDTVYIHTSGLTNIMKRVTGETNQKELKSKIEEVIEKFITAGLITEGFQKYTWKSSEGKSGKSVYLAIPAEYLREELTTERTSNIIFMEREYD